MLLKALITEKTIAETAKGRFAFVVSLDSTKTEIKKLIEKTFNVKVIKIQTLVMPGKSYRAGKRWVFKYRSDWKKAVVTLEKGQRIDLFDIKTEDKNGA